MSGPSDLRSFADRSMQPINQKLLGYLGIDKKGQMSVPNQVDTLIKDASNPSNLVGAPVFSRCIRSDDIRSFPYAGSNVQRMGRLDLTNDMTSTTTL
jgi:hypothetical protein